MLVSGVKEVVFAAFSKPFFSLFLSTCVMTGSVDLKRSAEFADKVNDDGLNVPAYKSG